MVCTLISSYDLVVSYLETSGCWKHVLEQALNLIAYHVIDNRSAK